MQLIRPVFTVSQSDHRPSIPLWSPKAIFYHIKCLTTKSTTLISTTTRRLELKQTSNISSLLLQVLFCLPMSHISHFVEPLFDVTVERTTAVPLCQKWSWLIMQMKLPAVVHSLPHSSAETAADAYKFTINHALEMHAVTSLSTSQFNE